MCESNSPRPSSASRSNSEASALTLSVPILNVPPGRAPPPWRGEGMGAPILTGGVRGVGVGTGLARLAMFLLGVRFAVALLRVVHGEDIVDKRHSWHLKSWAIKFIRVSRIESRIDLKVIAFYFP